MSRDYSRRRQIPRDKVAKKYDFVFHSSSEDSEEEVEGIEQRNHNNVDYAHLTDSDDSEDDENVYDYFGGNDNNNDNDNNYAANDEIDDNNDCDNQVGEEIDEEDVGIEFVFNATKQKFESRAYYGLFTKSVFVEVMVNDYLKMRDDENNLPEDFDEQFVPSQSMEDDNEEVVSGDEGDEDDDDCNADTIRQTKSTKGEVMQEYLSICASKNLKRNAYEEIIKLLFRRTNLNVPAYVSKKTGKLICNVQDYKRKKRITYRLDVCPKQCMLFINKNANKLQCPKCNEFRYKSCTYSGCTAGQGCESFTVNPHHQERRVPEKSIYVRSIITKLIDLCKLSINSKPDLFSYPRRRREGFKSDLNDGTVIVGEVQGMHDRFVKRKLKFDNDPANAGLVLKEFSIPLSIFYDGDKVYNQSAEKSVWPMLFCPLNTDPSFRTKLGMGLFLAFIHDLKINGRAEQSMIDDIMTEQLRYLEEGILLKFDDTRGDKQCIFLQARAIYFQLDTQAQSSTFHTQYVNAMEGCKPCGKRAQSRSIVSKVVLTHHGDLLVDNHILNNIGEKKSTAPPLGYYGEDHDGSQQAGKEISDLALQEDVELMEPKQKKQKITRNHKLFYHPERKLSADLVWYNNRHPWSNFENVVYSEYNDKRGHKPFSRVPHDEYVEKASFAKQKNINRKGKAESYDGYSYISMWAFLKFGLRFQWTVYDIMHYFANAFMHFMNLIAAERALHEGSRKLCGQECRFPWMRKESNYALWQATKPFMNLADSVMNCILVPTSYKTDYGLKYPFLHKGSLKSHRRKIFLVTYINFIFSFLDISDEHKAFFARYSDDLRGIMNPVLEDKAMPSLCNSVIETRVLQEKMFPTSEQVPIFHEIIDIVHHLPLLGVAGASACFTGERAMVELSDATPTGGRNYMYTTADNYGTKEDVSSTDFAAYERNRSQFIDNSGLFSPVVLKLFGQTKQVVLPRDESGQQQARDLLIDNAIEFLNSQSIDNIALLSPLARLYYVHSELHKTWSADKKREESGIINPFFSEWIDKLWNDYNKNKLNFTSQHVKTLVNKVKFTPDPSLSIIMDDNNSVEEISNSIQNDIEKGYIYLSDFDTVIKAWYLFGSVHSPLQTYNSMLVKGVQFRCRGADFAEYGLYTEHNVPVMNRDSNILANNWYLPAHINAWFRMTDYYHKSGKLDYRNKTAVAQREYFGQFNYAFRFDFGDFVDPVFTGLPFANAVLRTPVKDSKKHHNYIKPTIDSYYGDKQFVPLHYVDSTAIGVCALDEDSKPIKSPKEAAAAWTKDSNMKYSKMKFDQVDRLYFIELHPERLVKKLRTADVPTHIEQEDDWEATTDYASVSTDVDGTKVFEKR